MSGREVFIALSQFGEDDERPRAELLRAGFQIRENRLGRRLRREEILAAVDGADAVIAGVELYDAVTLSGFPRVRCISRCGVGTDSIDLDAAARSGIRVLNTPDEVVEPVAQITIGMMLALARNFPLHLAAARKGRWQRYTGHLLSEWTVGLVGFGRIGRAVEHYLRPFGSRVIAADPGIRQDALPAGVELRELPALLESSDLVSLHVSRPASEGCLLGRSEFSQMKKGSRLVNTARGYLLDEGALLEALLSGHVSGAALDVYQAEPYSGPLSALPQVLCTPHISSLTHASRRSMELKAVRNLIDFMGQPS